MHGLPRLTFVGSVTLADQAEDVAEAMRQSLSLSIAERKGLPTWMDALRQLIAKAEETEVLVMASSIVGSNSHRKLNVDEFRGFALADDLAPLVFLNSTNNKAESKLGIDPRVARELKNYRNIVLLGIDTRDVKDDKDAR